MKLTIVVNPAQKVCPRMEGWSDSQFEGLVKNILKEVQKINYTDTHNYLNYLILNINEDNKDNGNNFTSQKIKRELDRHKLMVKLLDISLNPSSMSDNDYCKIIFDTIDDMLSDNEDTIVILVSYKLFQTFPNFYIKQKYPKHKDEFCRTTSSPVAAVINRKQITTIFCY